MKIRILGGDGGVAPGCHTPSFLLDKKILIDAGSAAANLSLEDQKEIDYIFISHSHLDHVKDICFLVDNMFTFRKKPIELISSPEVLESLKQHIFNDKIWPDFSALSNGRSPILSYRPVTDSVELEGYQIQLVPVSHTVPAVGFLIKDQAGVSIIVTGDTGPTEEIWTVANREKKLKAIFTEIAFPNHLQSVADAACHYTPRSFSKEVLKLAKYPPFYIYHLKPEFRKELGREIKALKIPKLKLLKLNQRYTF